MHFSSFYVLLYELCILLKPIETALKLGSIISKNLVETFNLVNFAATSTFSNHLQNDIKQPVIIITMENLNKSLNNPSIYSLFGLREHSNIT